MRKSSAVSVHEWPTHSRWLTEGDAARSHLVDLMEKISSKSSKLASEKMRDKCKKAWGVKANILLGDYEKFKGCYDDSAFDRYERKVLLTIKDRLNSAVSDIIRDEVEALFKKAGDAQVHRISSLVCTPCVPRYVEDCEYLSPEWRTTERIFLPVGMESGGRVAINSLVEFTNKLFSVNLLHKQLFDALLPVIDTTVYSIIKTHMRAQGHFTLFAASSNLHSRAKALLDSAKIQSCERPPGIPVMLHTLHDERMESTMDSSTKPNTTEENFEALKVEIDTMLMDLSNSEPDSMEYSKASFSDPILQTHAAIKTPDSIAAPEKVPLGPTRIRASFQPAVQGQNLSNLNIKGSGLSMPEAVESRIPEHGTGPNSLGASEEFIDTKEGSESREHRSRAKEESREGGQKEDRAKGERGKRDKKEKVPISEAAAKSEAPPPAADPSDSSNNLHPRKKAHKLDLLSINNLRVGIKGTMSSATAASSSHGFATEHPTDDNVPSSSAPPPSQLNHPTRNRPLMPVRPSSDDRSYSYLHSNINVQTPGSRPLSGQKYSDAEIGAKETGAARSKHKGGDPEKDVDSTAGTAEGESSDSLNGNPSRVTPSPSPRRHVPSQFPTPDPAYPPGRLSSFAASPVEISRQSKLVSDLISTIQDKSSHRECAAFEPKITKPQEGSSGDTPQFQSHLVPHVSNIPPT